MLKVLARHVRGLPCDIGEVKNSNDHIRIYMRHQIDTHYHHLCQFDVN